MAELLLEARSVGLLFPGGFRALRGVDLRLEPGELVVLAGRNGAGKSVLARLLAGLSEPSEGSILFQGCPLRGLPGSPASRVGYLFQEARLQIVGERVEEDLRFGPENLGLDEATASRRVESALERCGLAGRRAAFVHSLSGGELRRLAIAGLLAMEPAALILDEPFANLDPEGVASILEVIEEERGEGRAVLVVTHELEKVLGLADRLVVMEGGEIALDGEPSSVLAAGVESRGLRDPLRAPTSVKDLVWRAKAR